MVIFLEDGRLGNQLFQYLGLRQYYPNHLLVIFGCNDLQNIVNSRNTIILKSRFFKNNIFLSIARYILEFLSTLRLISRDTEFNRGIDFSIIESNGLFNRFRWLSKAFFQHKNCIDLICDNFPINLIKESEFLAAAENILDDLGRRHSYEQLVFVHIRRGDYKTWPSEDSPAILPIEWYLRAMNRLRAEIKSPRFLIFSDDHSYVSAQFNGINDVTIIGESIYVDFLIMSQCEHGILSASSFSWWAGYFAHKKNLKGKFIGPRYWVGHRKKEWYPPHFKFDWIDYPSTNSPFIEQ
jgi:hypothetical protein